MNARRHTSALSLNLAALSLSGAGLPAATSGSAVPESTGISIDSVMTEWEEQDREERKMEFTIRVPAATDRIDIFKYGRLTRAEPIPMTSGKNLSPKRVEKRRRKKKLARSQRRRNRRQNTTDQPPR